MADQETEISERGPLPLDGVRVIEYAGFHAGPGGSAILGDLGAEVLKVEEFGGDPMRSWKEIAGVQFSLPGGEGLPFQFTCRNKKSVSLDIRSEKGWEIFCRMIRSADVFVTNLRRSTKARLGIDYGGISAVNPRIIYAAVSGFGPEGPLSDKGAYDPIGQASAGMMFATGTEEPALIQLAVLDQTTSIAFSHAILAALFMRERRGVGQEVHVSLYGTALWMLYTNLALAGCNFAREIPGDRLRFSPLRNYYRCKDGKWIIGTHHPEERYWPLLCEATGLTSLLSDPRLSDPSQCERRPEVIRLLDEVFATKESAEWLEILNGQGLMFGPVQRVKNVLTDPQALANGYVREYDHPVMGKVMIPGYPATFGAADPGTRSMAPALGEHTEIVLRELGYSNEELKRLRMERVIQ